MVDAVKPVRLLYDQSCCGKHDEVLSIRAENEFQQPAAERYLCC